MDPKHQSCPADGSKTPLEILTKLLKQKRSIENSMLLDGVMPSRFIEEGGSKREKIELKNEPYRTS